MKNNTFLFRKIFLLTFAILGAFSLTHAQLNKLCPISSTVYDKQKIKGINLLLNTKDFIPALVPGGKTHLTSTFQLVKATQPFPPLWFQMGNPATDTGSFNGTTFLGDIRIQENGGNLTLNGSYPPYFYGLITLDTATLEPIDTLVKYESTFKNIIKEHLDLHDYQVDAKGNKLFSNQVLRKIDLRCLSNLEKDSNRLTLINDILILNKHDSIIFYWNAVEHLTPCAMKWEYRNSSLQYGDIINWSHVNSVRFANDGNILYSYRHIGLGKINRQTGEIMWQLGGKDPLNSIQLTDTSGYYLQHDFLQRKDGLYSVFSNGDEEHPYLEALIYKIDEEKKTAELVSRYKPNPDIFSRALGNFDCIGNTCVISLGMYNIKTDLKEIQITAYVLFDNKLIATISAPALNYPYQVKQTSWAAIQRRPIVTVKNGVLYSDAKEGLHDYTWYKIEGTKAIPVGSGQTLKPSISGKYVVEAQQGTGLFRSYLISDVLEFKKKK